MRILLIGVGCVVLLVISVIVIGSLLPKEHVVSRRAAYRATPEQLFSLIAGPQDWRPDVLRYEAVPPVDGRELMRETARHGETITYELLDRIPPRSVKRRIATENLPYSGTWTYSLQANDGMTTVRITEDGQVYNPVSAATALASASTGANAHTDHESAAGSGDEREQVLEEKAVERTRASRTRKALVGSLG